MPVNAKRQKSKTWGAPGPPIPTSLAGIAWSSHGRQSRHWSSLKTCRPRSWGLSSSLQTRVITCKSSSDDRIDLTFESLEAICPKHWSTSSWECPVRRQDTLMLLTVPLDTSAAHSRSMCPFFSSRDVLSHWIVILHWDKSVEPDANWSAQQTASIELFASFGISASPKNSARNLPWQMAALRCRRGFCIPSNSFALRNGWRGIEHLAWSIPSQMMVKQSGLDRLSDLLCQ